MAHILLIEDDVGTASEIELELGGSVPCGNALPVDSGGADRVAAPRH